MYNILDCINRNHGFMDSDSDSDSFILDLRVLHLVLLAGLTGLCTLDLASECATMTHRFMYTRPDVNFQGTQLDMITGLKGL